MLRRKMLIYVVFFVLLLTTNVYGYEEEASETTNFFFFRNDIKQDELEDNNILFFSYCKFEENSNNIYSLFSNIDIGSKNDGEMYSFFSNVRIGESAYIENIKSVSSQITYSNEKTNIEPLYKILDIFISENKESKNKVYIDTIPNIVLVAIWICIKVFICFSFLALRKGFFLQGSQLIKHQKVSVIKNGLIMYSILVFIIVFFITTVLGIPISILFFILGFLAGILGQVSVGIYIGEKISKYLKIKSTYLLMIIAIVILEVFASIPNIGSIIGISLYQVIYQGVFITNIINYYIDKVYYEVPFELDYENVKDERNIKDIIKKDL